MKENSKYWNIYVQLIFGLDYANGIPLQVVVLHAFLVDGVTWLTRLNSHGVPYVLMPHEVVVMIILVVTLRSDFKVAIQNVVLIYLANIVRFWNQNNRSSVTVPLFSYAVPFQIVTISTCCFWFFFVVLSQLYRISGCL